MGSLDLPLEEFFTGLPYSSLRGYYFETATWAFPADPKEGRLLHSNYWALEQATSLQRRIVIDLRLQVETRRMLD